MQNFQYPDRMSFDGYAAEAMKTAKYPTTVNLKTVSGRSVAIYPFIKLSGEVGELNERVGKVLRDDLGIISAEHQLAMKLELGDILWYINACAQELGFTLDDVASANVYKLQSRAARNTIHGSGDNR